MIRATVALATSSYDRPAIVSEASAQESGATLGWALRTAAFWVFALSSAV